ncbi:TolC family protein [Acidobacteria bacterium AB60]|nr:TolC family protein [Acidobacteria bacterium AB60]
MDGTSQSPPGRHRRGSRRTNRGVSSRQRLQTSAGSQVLTGHTLLTMTLHYRGFAKLSIASALLAASASVAAQVSLATVVDLAQRNSSAVKIAQADVAKADAVYSESKDVIIPSLSVSTGVPVFPEVGFTGQPPSIWSASMQSLVFSIPQKHYIDAARSGLRAATSRLKDAREQAALDASSAYVELDAVNRELEAAHQQETMAARLVEIEQQRAEAGVDPLSEMLQARLVAANVKLARLHLESRAAQLSKQLASLTGLPLGSIAPDHASIPEIPEVHAEDKPRTLPGIDAARLIARSRLDQARGDQETNYFPQLGFALQYYRNTTILNSVNQFFAKPLPANNFASGISIQIPLFDMGHRAKGRESAADALRAQVEAEQAQRQNDLAISDLTTSLRELDAQAEVAALKQQIAAEQVRTVETQLENGSGAGSASGAAAQLSPRAEQLAKIDERQKFTDSEEASLGLARARLGLLRALGHMQDWLNELHTK